MSNHRYFHEKCRRSSNSRNPQTISECSNDQRTPIRKKLEEIVRNHIYRRDLKDVPEAFVQIKVSAGFSRAIDLIHRQWLIERRHDSREFREPIIGSKFTVSRFTQNLIRERGVRRKRRKSLEWTISIKSTPRSEARSPEEEKSGLLAKHSRRRDPRRSKRATGGEKLATQGGGARSRWIGRRDGVSRRRDRRHEPNWWQLGSVNWPAGVRVISADRSDRRKVESGST